MAGICSWPLGWAPVGCAPLGVAGRSAGDDPMAARSGDPGVVAEIIWLGDAAPGTW